MHVVSMLLLAFFPLTSLSGAGALAIPVPALSGRGIHELSDDDLDTSLGGRIAYLLVAILALGALLACFFKRYATRDVRQWQQWNAVKVLVMLIYLFSICFVISAIVIQYGFGLTTLSRCHSAIILCLVFYIGSKVTLYAFLIERAHAIRSPRIRRYRDFGWLGGMLCVVCGFGTISALTFVDPVFDMSEDDGRCQIGLPIKLTVSLLVFDIFMNLGTTFLFLVLLRPYLHGDVAPSWMKTYVLEKARRIFGGKRESGASVVMNRTNDKRVLEQLAYKSFWASFTILIGTVVNLTVLFRLHGREEGWVCFTTCTIDVVWGALVIHCITTKPEDMELPPPQSSGSTTAMTQRSDRPLPLHTASL